MRISPLPPAFFLLGLLFLLIASAFELLTMRRLRLAEMIELTCRGNAIRYASMLVMTLLSPIWLLIRKYGDEALFPHFLTAGISMAVVVVWAAVRECIHWIRQRVPTTYLLALIFGTPGIFLLELGAVCWLVADDPFDSYLLYVSALAGLSISLLTTLGFMYFLALRPLWRKREADRQRNNLRSDEVNP
jgi:hypothetical protein